MCCSSGSERQLGLPVRYSQWSSCLFKNLREIATVLRKKINRKRLLFNLFGRNTPFLQFCRQALRKVWYINFGQWQKKCKWDKSCSSHCFTTQNLLERTKRRDEFDLVWLISIKNWLTMQRVTWALSLLSFIFNTSFAKNPEV